MEFKRFPKKNDSVPPKNCVMYPFTLQPEVGHSRDTGAISPLGFVGYVVLPVKQFQVRKIPFSLLFSCGTIRFFWASSMAASGVPVMRWAVFTTIFLGSFCAQQ